jgi:hypothetical protein
MIGGDSPFWRGIVEHRSSLERGRKSIARVDQGDADRSGFTRCPLAIDRIKNNNI